MSEKLEPIFKIIRNEPSVYSTLCKSLPPRIKGPLIVTTSYVDDKGTKHEHKETIYPTNPSYNRENIRSRSQYAKVMWSTDEVDWPDGKFTIRR